MNSLNASATGLSASEGPPITSMPAFGSEFRFWQMLDALPAAIYTTDAQGHLTYFNPACVEFSGRTPTLGSDHWCVTWKLYHADGRPMPHDECPMAVALKEGRIIRGAEAIAERPDGTRIWFTPYPTPLLDNEGNIVGGVNMLVDITERKQSESLVQRQKEALELVVKGESIERVLDFLARAIETQSQGKFVVAIHLLEDDGYHFGYVAAPSLPARYAQATKGMDARLELGPCSSAVMSHTSTLVSDFASETRWPAFTDDVVALGLRGCFTTPILSPDQKVLGTFAIYYREPGVPSLHDRRLVDFVTSTVALTIERKQDEAALRESELRFRTLFDLGPVAVYSCDPSGVIREFNRRAAELWGRAPALGDTDERFCGSFRMIRPDGSVLAHEQCPMAEVLSGEVSDVRDAEVRIDRPDGSRVTVIVNIRPLRNEQGGITGAINCFYDITERKQAEQALRDSEERFRTMAGARESLLERERVARADAEHAMRVKDEFLATLSHELRTPLNAILGWSQLLKADLSDPQKALHAAEVIERNGRIQGQLIADMLDLSRILSGKMRLDVQHVALPEVVQAAIDSIRPAADAKGVRLQVLLKPQVTSTNGDPARLQQVAWNLLSNAVKFTPRDGRIDVVLTKVDSRVELRVSDTGEGISPEFLPRIFERFSQADGSIARHHGGLGIGLALVKELVELHGGRARVASEGVGKGATFVVELPIASIAASRDSLEDNSTDGVPYGKPFERAALKGVEILLVDDQADALMLTKRLLEESDAKVLPAASGAQALEVLEGRNIDVIVSDIGMSGMDGYTFIGEVRRRGIMAPALALTAFARPADRTRAMLSGYQAHLAKPASAAEFLAAVASLAERARASSAALDKREEQRQ